MQQPIAKRRVTNRGSYLSCARSAIQKWRLPPPCPHVWHWRGIYGRELRAPRRSTSEGGYQRPPAGSRDSRISLERDMEYSAPSAYGLGKGGPLCISLERDMEYSLSIAIPYFNGNVHRLAPVDPCHWKSRRERGLTSCFLELCAAKVRRRRREPMRFFIRAVHQSICGGGVLTGSGRVSMYAAYFEASILLASMRSLTAS